MDNKYQSDCMLIETCNIVIASFMGGCKMRKHIGNKSQKHVINAISYGG